jgi:Sulfotransferase family
MIDNRIFIVGCVRSGTTLLQSMLHGHPQIYSLPETKFFDCLIGIDRRAFLRAEPRGLKARLRALARDALVGAGVADPKRQFHAWLRLRELAKNAGIAIPAESTSLLVSRQAEGFVKLMDQLTLAAHKSIWLEKTPDHLFYIKHIARHVPLARFIHIVRSGTDNVASLYDNARKYPGPSWGQYDTAEMAVLRWNVAVEETLKYRNDKAHYLVRYEELASNPQKTLEGICAYLGCRFDGHMIAEQATAASALIEPHEQWKSINRKRLTGVSPSKFKELFDAEQRAYIERSLLPLPPLSLAA